MTILRSHCKASAETIERIVDSIIEISNDLDQAEKDDPEQYGILAYVYNLRRRFHLLMWNTFYDPARYHSTGESNDLEPNKELFSDRIQMGSLVRVDISKGPEEKVEKATEVQESTG